MTHFIGLQNLDDGSHGSYVSPIASAYTMEMHSMIGHPKKKITEEVFELGPSSEKKPTRAPTKRGKNHFFALASERRHIKSKSILILCSANQVGVSLD